MKKELRSGETAVLGCLKGLTCKHDREKVFTALRPLQGIRALRGPAKGLTVHNRGCGSIANNPETLPFIGTSPPPKVGPGADYAPFELLA